MDPHTSDSEDEDDEDFVPGIGEDDEDVSDDAGDGKRKLDDVEEAEDKPSRKRSKKYVEIKQTPTLK